MHNSKNIIAQFLRLFFQLIYTDLSWSYDIVAWVSSIGQWRAWQRTGLQVLPPGESLEVGIGTGHMLKELASGGYMVVGVDISQQMARIARRRLLKANLSAFIIQASTLQLPFKNSIFSSALSTFPSDFIYKSETFKELHRVLKPGGIMVIIPGVQEITGPKSGGKYFLRILDKLSAWLYALTGEETNPGVDWKENLIKELKAIGFSATIESVSLGRSVVIRVVAQKDFSPT